MQRFPNATMILGSRGRSLFEQRRRTLSLSHLNTLVGTKPAQSKRGRKPSNLIDLRKPGPVRRREAYSHLLWNEVKQFLDLGRDLHALSRLDQLVSTFPIDANRICDVITRTRPSDKATKQIGRILRKIQSRSGTRFLVNNGLLDSFIMYCGKAKRFDLAIKAFNVISLIPGNADSRKQALRSIATLSIAASICGKQQLSKKLLSEYYGACFYDYRQRTSELFHLVASGNITEIFQLLEDTDQIHTSCIPLELQSKIFYLAGYYEGYSGMFKAYRLLQRVRGIPAAEKAQQLHCLFETLPYSKPHEGVNRGDFACQLLTHGPSLSGNAKTSVVDLAVETQKLAPENERLPRMKAILKFLVKTPTNIPGRAVETLIQEAIRVNDVSLAIAGHAFIHPNFTHPVDHYYNLVNVALSLDENKLVGILLREFRESSFTPDDRMVNLLLVYAARVSSADDAYATVQKVVKNEKGTYRFLLQEVIQKLSAEGDDRRVVELWKDYVSTVHPWEIDPKTIRARFIMYRNEGNLVKAEAFLSELSKMGLSFDKYCYSALQQMNLNVGNLERAKAIRKEVKEKLLGAELSRIEELEKYRRMMETNVNKKSNERSTAGNIRFLTDQSDLGFARNSLRK
uniref:Pentacotripeptide-repeat region of PRORP domain-containing protein n=2 Tax=Rhodosorus marinus TaxID=101924 RepID=A0A7S3EH84_9RHOD|mmetsp:Transcript_32385/g.127011  ORF Transcript_32385/g.127011 Transcript_32385/m.127011 type:complete len:627 (+) Transcript_32385:500-2380(+)